MLSLYQLAFDQVICNTNGKSIYCLPLDLLKRYHQVEARVMCGKKASERIQEEHSIEMDPWMGYIEGLMDHIQTTHHLYINAVQRERALNRTGFRPGYMTAPVMVYYLQDEPWFNWADVGGFYGDGSDRRIWNNL